ncbi:MAG: RES domain-containing protein [Boseongicola sp.]|nr:RES domain-containing protein [Boseongicola sp.]
MPLIDARDSLSGRGAEPFGGRFNAKGKPALYAALSPATALREANRADSLQPTVLVSCRADLGPVFDTRNSSQLERRGMSGNVRADLAGVPR